MKDIECVSHKGKMVIKAMSPRAREFMCADLGFDQKMTHSVFWHVPMEHYDAVLRRLTDAGLRSTPDVDDLASITEF